MIPKSTLKDEDRSERERRSGIPLAFPHLGVRFVNLAKAMSYHFWDYLKTRKA